jgi:hypothetical protein
MEISIESALHLANQVEVGDGGIYRPAILAAPRCLGSPAKAAISTLLFSLTHSNPTGGYDLPFQFQYLRRVDRASLYSLDYILMIGFKIRA